MSSIYYTHLAASVKEILDLLKIIDIDPYDRQKVIKFSRRVDDLYTTVLNMQEDLPLLSSWYHLELKKQIYTLYTLVVLDPKHSFHLDFQDTVRSLFQTYERLFNNPSLYPGNLPFDPLFETTGEN